MALTHERCCEVAVAEIGRLAAVADRADPATPVPTCGDWTMADLLRHVGTVYRWAASMVRDRAQQRYRRDDMDWDEPDDDADLPAWIADGAAFVGEQFRACDPEAAMWTWGWPKNAGFWPRRMVHEVGVHRADAELALGRTVTFDAEIAADGVDELLGNLPHAAYFAPNVAELRGQGEVLAFEATDAGARWRVELRPDGFGWERHAAAATPDATATVSATARDLLLALYGRPACIAVAGDEDLVDRWIANAAL